jgi:hypothetical protein
MFSRASAGQRVTVRENDRVVAANEASVRAALRREMSRAMKERDRRALAAYRTALSAIDNAEAVPLTDEHRAGAVELSPLGVGRTDAERRPLTERDMRELVRLQAEDCRVTALVLERTNSDAAQELHRDAMLLLELLGQLA